MVRVVKPKPSLDAKSSLVRGTISAINLEDLSVSSFIGERATDAAVWTN